MTPEARTKKKIKSLLDNFGKDLYYFMPVAGRFGRAGVPDFILCANGRFIGVEAKANGGKPTALQRDSLRNIVLSGGLALIVDDCNMHVLERAVTETLYPTDYTNCDEVRECLIRNDLLTAEALGRLLDKFRRASNGCLIFQGALTKGGYGQTRCEQGQISSHTLMFRLFNGEVSAGLQLGHLCRYRACGLPAHLEAVSAQENVLRGYAPLVGRTKTQCPQGHAYDEFNTYIDKQRGRRCRTCARNSDSNRVGTEDYNRKQRERRTLK